MKYSIFSTVMCLSALASAPMSYAGPTGFVPPDEEAFSKVPLRETFFGAGRTPKADDLSVWLPTPGMQDEQFSCMGFAFGHGLLTILENRANHKVRAEPYSAAFIYNATKVQEPNNTCTSGVAPEAVFELLTKYGAPLDRNFSYSPHSCAIIESANHDSADYGLRRKLRDIKRINGPNTEDGVIHRVRDSISNKQPVVIGMPTGLKFADYSDGTYPTNFRTIHDNASISEIVPPTGYHAMVIIGFDQRRKAFRIMNSYGKDWGSLGFAWLDENFVERSDVFLWTAKLGEKTWDDDALTMTTDAYSADVLISLSQDSEIPASSITETVSESVPPSLPDGAPEERSTDTETLIRASQIGSPPLRERAPMPDWFENSTTKEKAFPDLEVFHDLERDDQFGKKLASSLRGTVGHTANGQTKSGLDYYPVSIWLRLADDDLNKIERVEYHWQAPSYTSPKVPVTGSESAFLVEYSGYGAVNWATVKVTMKDGKDYVIDYPFESLWEYGELSEDDLARVNVRQNPTDIPNCPDGSKRREFGVCVIQ